MHHGENRHQSGTGALHSKLKKFEKIEEDRQNRMDKRAVKFAKEATRNIENAIQTARDYEKNGPTYIANAQQGVDDAETKLNAAVEEVKQQGREALTSEGKKACMLLRKNLQTAKENLQAVTDRVEKAPQKLKIYQNNLKSTLKNLDELELAAKKRNGEADKLNMAMDDALILASSGHQAGHSQPADDNDLQTRPKGPDKEEEEMQGLQAWIAEELSHERPSPEQRKVLMELLEGKVRAAPDGRNWGDLALLHKVQAELQFRAMSRKSFG